MGNIIWLSPTWTTVFILAVLTLLVTLFWDNIKRVFTDDKQGTLWNKFNNFVSKSAAMTVVRYFLGIAIMSYGIYCFATLNSAACGVTFIVLAILLAVIGIPVLICGDFCIEEVEIGFTFILLFINFLMALMVFIYGGGVTGFYIIATLGINFIVLPKRPLFEQ